MWVDGLKCLAFNLLCLSGLLSLVSAVSSSCFLSPVTLCIYCLRLGKRPCSVTPIVIIASTASHSSHPTAAATATMAIQHASLTSLSSLIRTGVLLLSPDNLYPFPLPVGFSPLQPANTSLASRSPKGWKRGHLRSTVRLCWYQLPSLWDLLSLLGSSASSFASSPFPGRARFLSSSRHIAFRDC